MQFYYEDKLEKPVKASGILFLDKKNNNILFQELIKKKDDYIYCDFGGKIDSCDNNILDIAVRELLEESNNSFICKKKNNVSIYNHDNMVNYISENLLKTIYIPRSKYVLYIVKITDFFKIDKKKFGEFECIDKIKRNISWININLVNTINLHPRLWNYELNEYFKILNINEKGYMFNN